MRILLTTLLLSLACLCSQASTVVTLTLTVTNSAGTTNGESFSINGDARIWTNSVFDPTAQIRTATNATLAAQNLLVQVAAHPFTGLSLSASTATSISLRTAPDGASPTVTLSTNWGTVSLATNTVGNGVIVRMPLTLESAAVQTNVASALAAAINSSANTNPVVATYAPQAGHATNADRTITATNAPDGYPLLSTNSSLNAAKLTGALSLNTSGSAGSLAGGLASLGIDWAQTNFVSTNAIALKVPVLTNAGTVFYLMLTTNVP